MRPRKPVILVGEGCRGADLSRLFKQEWPILSSWQAADLIDNDHPLYFGRPGVFGQRTANKILYNADFVLSIGCRLSIWMVGHAGLRPEQVLHMVDVDKAELDRFPKAMVSRVDAGWFIKEASHGEPCPEWLAQCDAWRQSWFDKSHHSGQHLNAYDVVNRLQPYLRHDEVIVTDMGVALCGAYQVLNVKPPQRLITSGGLGEMGVALPAAIGASIARGNRDVLCLHCDGGMMMNLQELQTIVHHKLPIKIMVFNNGGYVMIKSTQKNLRMDYSGVDSDSGVSLPNFRKLAYAFGIQAGEARTVKDLDAVLPQFFAAKEPSLLEVFTDPEQALSPKLQPIVEGDVVRSPSFEELSP